MYVTIGRNIYSNVHFTYCVLPFALMDLGSIYNVNETSAFFIVKVQMSNDENKFEKMGSCWHCKPASKFALCGDVGYRHHILPTHGFRGMFFLVQSECHLKGTLMKN